MKLRKLLVLAFGLFAIPSLRANAFSFVYDPSYPIQTTQQRAIIYYDKKAKLETIVASPTFRETEPRLLSGWWKFDEGAGKLAYDSSGNSNTGTLLGGVSWIRGKTGSSIRLDGKNNSYVTVASTPSLNPRNYITISAWVNPNQASEKNGAAVACKGYANGNEIYCIDFPNASDLTPRFYIWGMYGSLYQVYAAKPLPQDTWSHVAAVSDGVNIYLYVNGQLSSTAPGPSSFNTNYHQLTVGCRESQSGIYDLCFDGAIDDLRIYNWAKSAEDIQNIYEGKDDLTKDLSVDSGVEKVRNFGFIIPVPARPAIDIVKSDVFSSIEELTRPRYEYDYPPMGISPMMGVDLKVSPPEAPVKVVEAKKADVYEISTLKASDKAELTKWFKDNGFVIPKGAEYVIDEYIGKGYFFVVAKINPETLGPYVLGQIREGSINPIKLTFSTDQIVYPVKLAGALGAGETNPYPYTKIAPSGLNMPTPGIGSQGGMERGGIIAPQPFPPSQYVNTTLYVIENHKKQLSGFSTTYAGDVSKKKLEGLSVNERGESWMKFSGKKYVTALSGSLTYSQMNNDLVITDADNNTTVGGGGYALDSRVKFFLIIGVPIVLEMLLITYFIKRRRN